MFTSVIELFQYAFMIRALVAGLLIAVTAPLIGHFLVMKRFSLISDTLSHVALAGVAVGVLTNTQPLFATAIVTVLVALLIERLQRRNSLSGDTVLALLLPGGLATSLVLLSLVKGFNASLLSILFGSITTVQSQEIWLMVGMAVVTMLIVIKMYQSLLYSSFDEESARVHGVNTIRVNQLLLIMTALVVSLAMRVVGVLLIGALLTIPVITAASIAKSFKQSMIVSILLAMGAVVAGLIISFFANTPTGATIVLSSLALFLIFRRS